MRNNFLLNGVSRLNLESLQYGGVFGTLLELESKRASVISYDVDRDTWAFVLRDAVSCVDDCLVMRASKKIEDELREAAADGDNGEGSSGGGSKADFYLLDRQSGFFEAFDVDTGTTARLTNIPDPSTE